MRCSVKGVSVCTVVIFCLFFGNAGAAEKNPDSLVLKTGEGYSFSERKLVKDNAELIFSSDKSGHLMKALRIKGYGKTNPTKVSAKEVAGWKQTEAKLEAGNYYILLSGKDRLYLIKIVSIKAAPAAELDLKWAEIDTSASRK